MNKSDLKDGMMLKLRNNNIYSLLHGYLLELSLDDTYKIIASMDDYNDEFKNCNSNLDDSSVLDVMKIYDKDMNELWLYEEVCWSNIPFGTKVVVSNDNFFTEEVMYFINKSGDDYFVVDLDRDEIGYFKYCELLEDPEEEIGLVDVLSDMDKNCDKINKDGECDKYDNCDICKVSYILNNYDVKRKIDTQSN